MRGDIEAREEWFALAVKTGAEFAMAQTLERRGFQVWAPRKVIKRRGRRKGREVQTHEVPVLRGFVFLGADAPAWAPSGAGAALIDWQAASRFRNVFGVLCRCDAPAAILTEEIQDMLTAAKAAPNGVADLSPGLVAGEFSIGDEVRIVEGALEGFDAVVSEIGRDLRGDHWTKLVVKMFGASRPVQISVDSVIRPD